MTLLNELRNYEEVRTARIFTRQGNPKVKRMLDREIARYDSVNSDLYKLEGELQ